MIDVAFDYFGGLTLNLWLWVKLPRKKELAFSFGFRPRPWFITAGVKVFDR